MKPRFLLIGLSVLLAACVSQSRDPWPLTVPSQQEFQRLYRADPVNQLQQGEAEYLDWILSFYRGSTLYALGWLEIESMVLSSTSVDARQQRARSLRELGIEIGGEWAKHNNHRRIDSRMLSLWGSLLLLAPDNQQQAQAIEVIAADVEALLSGTLEGTELTQSRYLEIFEFQQFEGF